MISLYNQSFTALKGLFKGNYLEEQGYFRPDKERHAGCKVQFCDWSWFVPEPGSGGKLGLIPFGIENIFRRKPDFKLRSSIIYGAIDYKISAGNNRIVLICGPVFDIPVIKSSIKSLTGSIENTSGTGGCRC